MGPIFLLCFFLTAMKVMRPTCQLYILANQLEVTLEISMGKTTCLFFLRCLLCSPSKSDDSSKHTENVWQGNFEKRVSVRNDQEFQWTCHLPYLGFSQALWEKGKDITLTLDTCFLDTELISLYAWIMKSCKKYVNFLKRRAIYLKVVNYIQNLCFRFFSLLYLFHPYSFILQLKME